MIDVLVTLLIYILVLAILYWAFVQIPIIGPYRWIVNVLFAIVAVILVLSLFGGGGLPRLHLG